jgi:Protein of unknown function (DUF3096)
VRLLTRHRVVCTLSHIAEPALIAPVVALIAGILILVVPRLLNYIVAIYLIVSGLLGLFGNGGFHMH